MVALELILIRRYPVFIRALDETMYTQPETCRALLAALFLAGMIGHDRVGYRSCSSLLLSGEYWSLWRDLLAVRVIRTDEEM